MNDPGLDASIAQHTKAVDGKYEKAQKQDEEDEREEDEQEFLAPTLIAINACQLVIALVSNLFLLFNMARRVRFTIAQPITIVGWYISSFTLLGLTATASGPLRLPSPPQHAFTEAFYYAIFSAILYFIVASLMVITVIGALLGHYDREFKLTMSQRTLMLQTISFLVYLLCGAAVYAHIEEWEYLDAVYWADFTLLTVGIGDYAPKTHLGRGLLFPFAIVGIIILGLVIGSIRSLVLERGKLKVSARLLEKERQRILKALEKLEFCHMLQPIGPGTRSRSSSQTFSDHRCDIQTERRRREAEFNMMRDAQEKAAVRRKWMSLVISGSVWFGLWFGGAAIFQQTERSQNWSYYQSLYFAYTSLLTIGYGDLFPMSNSGKPFFVFWSLLAVPSLTILISNMGDTVVKAIRDLTLWIGHLTVLPGDQGLRSELKTSLHKATSGRVFPGRLEESPPGIMGESKRPAGSNSESDAGDGIAPRGHAHTKDPDSAAQKANAARKVLETNRAKERADRNDDDATPQSRRHYHLMLAREVTRVMKHLNSSPPRKYTFDEWAWFLKLVGEDESDWKTHRAPMRKPKREGRGTQSAVPEGGAGGAGSRSEGTVKGEMKSKVYRWSWLGNRSPLMGNKEEAEWLLERLMKTLERELEAMRGEEVEEGEGGEKGAPG